MVWSRRKFIRNTGIVSAGTAMSGLGPMLNGCATSQYYDFHIIGGQIIDGTGSPPVKADLAVVGDKIVKIGTFKGVSNKTIDASGKIICPGFIDIHSHTDLSLLVNPRAESKIRQGVTTEVVGQDGASLAPITRDKLRLLQEGYGKKYGVNIDWMNFTSLFDKLQSQGIGVNWLSLVGQGTIREQIVGNENKEATKAQLEQMEDLVGQAMTEGAWGLSSGLEYTPGSFASEDEIAALCKVTSQYGGFYSSHIRNEDDFLVQAVSEAIRTAKKGNIALQIAHFKASGRRNLPKVSECLELIDKEIENGMDITMDRYPYIAYATTLQNIFPTHFRSGSVEDFLERLQSPKTLALMKKAAIDKINMLGDWGSIMITSVKNSENQKFIGKRVSEIVFPSGQNPFDFVKELLITENGSVGMVGFGMSEEEISSVLRHPRVMIASDGGAAADYGPLSLTKPHPRYYGTFPRTLGKYCRENQLFDLPTAVHKMTGLPAMRLGLTDRGILDTGYFADLVIFDPKTIEDQADFMNPHQYPTGIDYVMINGTIAVEYGEHTGVLSGRVLRKNSK